MDKTVLAAIIATIPPSLMALLAWKQAIKTNETVEKTSKAVREVHVSINSRMDQLLKSSKAESRAEGIKEGRQENEKTS